MKQSGGHPHVPQHDASLPKHKLACNDAMAGINIAISPQHTLSTWMKRSLAAFASPPVVDSLVGFLATAEHGKMDYSPSSSPAFKLPVSVLEATRTCPCLFLGMSSD